MSIARYRVGNPLTEIWNFSYFFFRLSWVKTHRTPLEHILRRETHPICETYKVTLSVRHILCECKKFISIRNTLELNSKLSVILSNEKILDKKN